MKAVIGTVNRASMWELRGGACIPPSRAPPAPAEIARYGFKPLRARPEPFPNGAEIGRNIEFLTVNVGFEPSSNVVST